MLRPGGHLWQAQHTTAWLCALEVALSAPECSVYYNCACTDLNADCAEPNGSKPSTGSCYKHGKASMQVNITVQAIPARFPETMVPAWLLTAYLPGHQPTLGSLYSWPSPQQCTSPEMKLKRRARRLEISCSVSTSMRRSCGGTDHAWLGPGLQSATHLPAAWCDCLYRGQGLWLCRCLSSYKRERQHRGLHSCPTCLCGPAVQWSARSSSSCKQAKWGSYISCIVQSAALRRSDKAATHPCRSSSRQVEGHTASSGQQQEEAQVDAVLSSGAAMLTLASPTAAHDCLSMQLQRLFTKQAQPCSPLAPQTRS